MVLLKQRSDLFPLVRGEFQILGQMIEFLIDRPRLPRLLLGHGDAGHPEREHASQSSGNGGSHKSKASGDARDHPSTAKDGTVLRRVTC